MTKEQIEDIARRAHFAHVCNTIPGASKDPKRHKYWDLLNEELKESWRRIIEVVAEEILNKQQP